MPCLYAVQMNIYGYPFQPLKIGTSTNPTVRAQSYNSGPFPTTWLGAWEEEDPNAERKLHLKFKDYRLAGEWFYPSRGLVRYVENKTGYPIEVSVCETPSDSKVEFQSRFVRLFPFGSKSLEREWAHPGRARPCGDRAASDAIAALDEIEVGNPLRVVLANVGVEMHRGHYGNDSR